MEVMMATKDIETKNSSLGEQRDDNEINIKPDQQVTNQPFMDEASSRQELKPASPTVAGAPESATSSDLPSPPLADDSPFADNTPPSLLRESLVVGTVILSQLLARAGLPQGIAPLTYIGATFSDPSPAVTLWFPAAFSLTAGTFILVSGRVGDLLGHKRVFLAAMAWYALWSLLAGLAAVIPNRSVIFFDVCRAMQGVSAAVLTPTGLAILGSMYRPGRRKAKVFALYGVAAPNGMLLGLLFSALLAEEAWWPWGFWVLALVCVASGVLAWYVLPEIGREAENLKGAAAPSKEKEGGVGGGDEEHKERHATLPANPPQPLANRFDWMGSLTGVLGLTLFNVAWNQAPSQGWSSPSVIVILVLGVLFIVAFVVVERREPQPILPIAAMSGEALYVVLCVALGWASFGIWLYYFWEFVVRLRGATPLQATAQIVPGTLSGWLVALLTGFLLSRVRNAQLMVVAMLAFCVGCVLVAPMPVQQTYWLQAFWSVVIIPFGMGLSFPVGTLLMSNLVPQRHQGAAASTIAATVNYSISIGLGVAGTVEAQVARGDLLRGFQGGWYTAVGLSGLGVIVAVVHGVVDANRQRKLKREASEKEHDVKTAA